MYRTRSKYVSAPCPACLSRAKWIPIDHTDKNALPADTVWVSPPCACGAFAPGVTQDAHRAGCSVIRVAFNANKERYATFKRTYDPRENVTVFWMRDPKHVNMARKGENCNPCADAEERGY